MATPEAVLGFYDSLTKNPGQLAQGYQLIKTFLLQGQQFREVTLLNLLHPQVPIVVLVRQVYCQQILVSPAVSQQQKRRTREFLLEMVIQQLQVGIKQSLQNLFIFLRSAHNQEGYEAWHDVYQTAIQCISINCPNRLGFFLNEILKKADDRINFISRYLPSLLCSHFSFISQEQAIQIWYYSLRTMACLYDSDPEVIKTFLQPYKIQLTQTLDLALNGSPLCMLFALKATTILCRDYSQCISQAREKQLEVLCLSLSGAIMKQKVGRVGREKDEDQQEGVNLGDVFHQLLELIDTLTTDILAPQTILAMIIASICLSDKDCTYYQANTEIYLCDLQDETQQSIRNRCLSIITTLSGSDGWNTVKKGLQMYVNECLVSGNINNVEQALQRLSIQPARPLVVHIESAIFLLLSFSEDLKIDEVALLSKVASITPQLGFIQLGALELLSKLASKLPKPQRIQLIQFVLERQAQHPQDPIMALGVCKAIARCRSGIIFSLVGANIKSDTNLPVSFLETLLHYALQEGQRMCAHLVIDFFELLSRDSFVFQSNFFHAEAQYKLLKKYIDDGMTSRGLISLLTKVADTTLIERILLEAYKEVRTDNLMELLGQWVGNGKLILSQPQIMELIRVYARNESLLSNLIKSYMERATVFGEAFHQAVNRINDSSWSSVMLRKGLIVDVRAQFDKRVKVIADELFSQYEIEGELVLLYAVMLNHPAQATEWLRMHPGAEAFSKKWLAYAPLFQGKHLQVITCHVLLALDKVAGDHSFHQKVVRIVKSYGKIEVDEWEDQDREDQENEESLFDLKIVNKEVENSLLQIFGDLAWDTAVISSF